MADFMARKIVFCSLKGYGAVSLCLQATSTYYPQFGIKTFMKQNNVRSFCNSIACINTAKLSQSLRDSSNLMKISQAVVQKKFIRCQGSNGYFTVYTAQMQMRSLTTQSYPVRNMSSERVEHDTKLKIGSIKNAISSLSTRKNVRRKSVKEDKTHEFREQVTI